MNASPRIITLDELCAMQGQEIGRSDWLPVTQERIDDFADATEDHQWIHVDRERAQRELPEGRTIAHGNLILSLIPLLSSGIKQVSGIDQAINYGFDRIRFIRPVHSGDAIRIREALISAEEGANGSVRVRSRIEIEKSGSESPVAIVEEITLYLRA